MKTSGAVSGEIFVEMTTFPFQCRYSAGPLQHGQFPQDT